VIIKICPLPDIIANLKLIKYFVVLRTATAAIVSIILKSYLYIEKLIAYEKCHFTIKLKYPRLILKANKISLAPVL